MATRVVSDVIPISKQLGSSYHLIRIAALSGAAAVCLAAYGRHSMKDTIETKDYRNIYESANNIHFIHSVALLATPITKRPLIVIFSILYHFLSNDLILYSDFNFRLEHFLSLECFYSVALAIIKPSKNQKVNLLNIYHRIWLHMVAFA